MDNKQLSLQNFTSVFEIFAGYYLLLGTNKNFHDYFNVAGVFKNWISNYDKIEKITSESEQLEANFVQQVDREEPAVNTLAEKKRITRLKMKRLNRGEKTVKQFKLLVRLSEELKYEVDVHFGPDPETETETDFYRFVKPFYIFFGTLSMSVLVLSGFIEEWNKLSNLNILNCFGAIMFCVMGVEIFRNHYQHTGYMKLNPVRVFVLSIIILTVIVLLPPGIYGYVQFMNYVVPEQTLSYNNSQILLIVALIFLPIIVHIITLSFVVRKHRKVEQLVKQLANYLQPISKPPIQDDIATLS